MIKMSLDNYIKDYGITAIEISEVTGVSLNTITTYKTNQDNMKISFILKLKKAFPHTKPELYIHNYSELRDVVINEELNLSKVYKRLDIIEQTVFNLAEASKDKRLREMMEQMEKNKA